MMLLMAQYPLGKTEIIKLKVKAVHKPLM